MLIFLFILGFGGGCDSVIANTVALESFPPSKASKVTLLSVAWSLGSSLTYILALGVVWSRVFPILPWRVVVGVSVLYTMYASIERLRLKETPVFLYNSHKYDVYKSVINEIRRINEILPRKPYWTPKSILKRRRLAFFRCLTLPTSRLQ